MSVRIVNVDPTQSDREIAEIGVNVPFGGEVEVEKELADRLLEQENVWARPTTKAAKQAEKEADDA